MSYHVQQNPQQRSVGIFIVVAFHVLLIWALASGLGVTLTKWIPEPIKLSPTVEKITPPTTVDPVMPVIATSTTIQIDPTTTTINIDSDTQPQVIASGGSDIIAPAASISKPRLIKATKPDYPSAASRLGEEGSTGLKLLINTDGRVADVQLVSSSGSTRLDDAAIKHAKRNWAFSPCTEGGKAIACWHQTKLVWRLEDAAR